jgi:hypothetical protein
MKNNGRRGLPLQVADEQLAAMPVSVEVVAWYHTALLLTMTPEARKREREG